MIISVCKNCKKVTQTVNGYCINCAGKGDDLTLSFSFIESVGIKGCRLCWFSPIGKYCCYDGKECNNGKSGYWKIN